MPSLDLILSPDPGTVPPALEAVEDFLAGLGVGTKPVRRMQLALEEILLNAILHGAPDADIRLSVGWEGDLLTCEVVDTGPQFDPFAEAPPPDLSSPIEDRRVGGLGVHLTKQLMSACSYERRAGRNHTRLQLAVS